ncbi:hypothetical protein HG535_0B04010 [Zygotorulaspora mrakii]|uniref:Uncharacterized protein n=1 Tax=Zygotorulaspora mrakii TaxID=42260 RepID=A0A7H9AYI1_ZYGMR|nr:uncharacterized protein HG535_0B04010 [Zygotorulaspora mrakii]QLG71361.1 hypothetical protein HG535_0B04010 [Zygotorulaspora mrakii]
MDLLVFHCVPLGVDIEVCEYILTCVNFFRSIEVVSRDLSHEMKDIIISDFDDTITSRDTISLLGELPYLINPLLNPKWSYFQDAYMSNYHKFQKNPQAFGAQFAGGRTFPLLCSSNETVTSANFYTLFATEIRYQQDRRLLEMTSTEEMTKRGLFKGITHSDICRYVEYDPRIGASLLRNGFMEFISSLDSSEFYIISINWSKEFIHEVVGTSNIEASNIFCNELISQNGIYTGKFSNQILAGSDKLHELEKLLRKHQSDETDNRFWYIGDSETDLLSILHPKVNGLLLLDPESEKKKLMKLATEVLGIPLNELKLYVQDKNVLHMKCFSKENGNGFFLVKSWFAIQELVRPRST